MPRVRQVWTVLVAICMSLSFACGGAQAPPSTSESGTDGSKVPSELNFIMKNEVNKPFSKLTFFVFHSGGDYNFSEIDKVRAAFHAGISKVRAYPNPPVETKEGREVFATFLENLDRDSNKLAKAIQQKDGQAMEAMVGRLSRTCNNCHHFFRLDIADTPEQ